MAVDKLGIYNDALRLIGETFLDTLTDEREARFKLDQAWDLGALDHCLEIVKPKFATVTVETTGVATTGNITLAFTHTLPTDFVTIVQLYSDGELDQEVTRFMYEGNTLLTDYQVAYLRYIQDVGADEPAFLLKTTPAFRKVVAAYLALELTPQFDPQKMDIANAKFNEAVQQAMQLEQAKEPLRPKSPGSPLTEAWRTIYNDALQLLGREKLPKNDADHPFRVALDTSREAGAVTAVLEDTGWQFGMTSNKITFDPAVEPEWGYRYAFEKPADLQRISGIYSDEYMMYPLKDYADEDRYWFAEITEIYVKYVDSDTINEPSSWPIYFRRLIAARIASDAAPEINPELLMHAKEVYEDRKRSAMSNDVMSAPPHKWPDGRWNRSRGTQYGRGYGRGRP